nr:hypothetical protein [uncultured Flavobacterium sp.]
MIKVSYLVSYDYFMLLTSIKQLYDYVDKIVVAIDIDRKTWSGNNFEIPESFFIEIKKYDIANKIDFYFDVFYLPELTPMECECRERNMVLQKLGRGWKIQLDVDEYIYDFETLAKYLNSYWFFTLFPKYTPVSLKASWITLFKKVSEGYFYLDNKEIFAFATNQSFNTYARDNNKALNFCIDLKVIHQSWARSENEIFFKIKNWGHRDDFDTMKYFEFWNNLNIFNYKKSKNIHPLRPEVWNELYFLESSTIDEFITKFSKNNIQVLSPMPTKKIVKSAIKKILGKK